MKKIDVTDEMLYECMPRVDKAIIDRLEADTDRTHKFSPEFEQRMERLVHKETGKNCRIITGILKFAAIILACIIGVGALLTISVDAYRIEFFETINDIWEDSIFYTYETRKIESRTVAHEPTYIPKGYEEMKRQDNDVMLLIRYKNEEGMQIAWERKRATDNRSYVIDSDHIKKREKKVNGYPVIIYQDDTGLKTAYCEFGEYIYTLTASNLSNKEIYRIFQSMYE